MTSVNCVIIWKNKAIEFARRKVKDGAVEVTKEWQPLFELSDFIPEKRPKRRFWGKETPRKNYLLLKEDLPRALEPTATKFNEHWTPQQAQKFIAKVTAKSAATQKPFSNLQVIGLIAAIIASSFITALLVRFVVFA